MSLRIIFQILKKSTLNVTESFIWDFRIAHWMAIEGEFYEGVRTVLINKGDSPKWKYI